MTSSSIDLPFNSKSISENIEDKENIRKRPYPRDKVDSTSSASSSQPPSSEQSFSSINTDSTVLTLPSKASEDTTRKLQSAVPLTEILCVNDILAENPIKNHPVLDVYDRASVVYWVTEVCEAFALSCETAELAVNYLDRCLCNMSNMDRKQMQVLAMACMYVASKLEEVYPPSLLEFSDISDHLCKIHHIANLELEILLSLEWRLRITPASTCLNYLCQCYDMSIDHRNLSEGEYKKQPPEVQIPRQSSFRRFTSMAPTVQRFVAKMHTTYDTTIFSNTIRVLNLAIMDSCWSQFSGLSLAASALCFVSGKKISQIPNLSIDEYERCLRWMKPFYDVMKNVRPKFLKLPDTADKRKLSPLHRIQQCEGSIILLKEAHALAEITMPNDHYLLNISNKKFPIRPLQKRRKLC
ncbi:hypothetical protein GJ496_009101 [Pomphorhynchus laevis]|nr:hypothetical protein GJ496_009101 [Pomphorhynchus laevis]